MIRSFRSLAFFKPPNAIFVPGMYFFGFSRYSNCGPRKLPFLMFEPFTPITHQRTLLPCDALGLVRVGVLKALDLARLPSKQTVQVRADLVAAVGFEDVALGASRL